MGIVQVFLDPSSPWVITGSVEFDVDGGAHLQLPGGTSFPIDPAPVSGDYFVRTDLLTLNRFNGATWVPLTAVAVAHAASHQPGGSDAMAVDAVAGTGSLRTLGTGAQQACAGTDSRLSDARTPTAHSTSHKHGGSDEVATATAGANVIPKAGAGGKLDIGFVPTGSTGTTVCIGNDARLSDARTPTAHKTSHEPGGGDALTVDAVAGTGSLRTLGTGAQQACSGNDSRLSDARTPTAHKASHEPGGGDALTVDAVAGTGSLRTLGTGAQQACSGSDARLSDARTPTAHAASHKSGGSDSIRLDELAAPTDVTTLNATTGQHGLLPKLGGGTANVLRADGTWGAPVDPNAIHKNVAAEISTITEKAAPVSADLLVIEDSADSNNKKRVQIGNLPAGSAPIFGSDYASQVSEANSTTTSSTYQDKVSLVTGALTGTYLVEWQCEMTIASANRQHQCRLYDATAAVELCNDDHRPSIASAWKLASGFALVTFSGSAKTLKIQFASQNNSTTVTIRRARIVMWRVS